MKNNDINHFITFLASGLTCAVIACSPVIGWSTGHVPSNCQEMIPQENDNSEEYDGGISPLNDDLVFNDQKQ